MSEKCKGCGAEETYNNASDFSPAWFITYFACGTQHRVRGDSVWWMSESCVARQLAQAREREATEKARADKAEARLDGILNKEIGPKESELRREPSSSCPICKSHEIAYWGYCSKGSRIICLRCGWGTELTAEERIGRIAYRLEKAEAEAGRLRDVLGQVPTEINAFQGIIGWQPGESRNLLVVRICDKIEKMLYEALAPSGAEGEAPNDA